MLDRRRAGGLTSVEWGPQSLAPPYRDRRAKRPHLPGDVPRLGDEALRIGVTVLAATFSPLMGALLAAYLAYDADRDGRTPTRNLMIVLLGFSLVGLVAYAQIWGGLFFGI